MDQLMKIHIKIDHNMSIFYLKLINLNKIP